MKRGGADRQGHWGTLRPPDPRSSPGGRGLRPAYLGADSEVVVGDKLGALVVARVEPGVEGAEGHARQCQHEGQEAPGSGCRGEAEMRQKWGGQGL